MNCSKLRDDVRYSSPEIRTLYSKLQECAIAKQNQDSSLEKQCRERNDRSEQKKYADLIGELDKEEAKITSLQHTSRLTEELKLGRELEEQIQVEKVKRALVEAERAIDDLAKEDDYRQLQLELQECRQRKIEKAASLRDALLNQQEAKSIEKKKAELEESEKVRRNEESLLLKKLKEEYAKQKAEIRRLEAIGSQWNAYTHLEKETKSREELRNVREELRELQWQEEKDRKEQLLEEKKKQKYRSLLTGRDEQIRTKQMMLQTEMERERKYVQMLTELQNEEAKTEFLNREARKRRERAHKDISEKILEDRKRSKEYQTQVRELENLVEEREKMLRISLLQEEERQLIIKHAPHLDTAITERFLRQIVDL